MAAKTIAEYIAELEKGNVRFARLRSICETFFGPPRVPGSHHIFKMPWAGDPRINIQEGSGGKAKDYQVKQVIAALTKLL